MTASPYSQQIEQVLPQLLALLDVDPTSTTLGQGDRYHWAWGLIDFPNGTFQGAAHGLARLWKNDLWPYSTSQNAFLQRIDAIFSATAKMTRKDGSLEEAFPNEGSFCVTALVAYDLLCALDLLDDINDKEISFRWQSVISPLIEYLKQNNETHALISNHLATAVAALSRWYDLTGDESAEVRAKAILDDILKHQSNEGWFEEYGGADSGYQSLCTYYLADVHIRRPDWRLLEPLRKSVQFLWLFAHPDGSFGGLYGSRCTRFYYPAGFEALAEDIPEARALANYMRQSISRKRVVTLITMDPPNLIPMFNSYCWAATFSHNPTQALTVPAQERQIWRKVFSHAGLLVDSGDKHYTIVSTAKGGVVVHYVDDKLKVIDGGVVIRNHRNRTGSTQYLGNHEVNYEADNTLTVRAAIAAMPKAIPTSFQFLVIRILSLTLFRFTGVREWFKQKLVKLLITRNKIWPASNQRTITLGQDIKFKDATDMPKNYSIVKNAQNFVPIHMASQGYWQIQDEENTP